MQPQIFTKMKQKIDAILNNKKSSFSLLIALLAVILIQGAIVVSLFYRESQQKYVVNLVRINTQKDSLNAAKLKNDLSIIDQSIRKIHSFLVAKRISDQGLESLSKDSLSSVVYLSKQSSRYVQHLVDLEKKLRKVPLGSPVDGALSSPFGMRKNPIPSQKLITASMNPFDHQTSLEKDSTNAAKNKKSNHKRKNSKDNTPMQFHKGIDIASPFGSEVMCAAEGKVIFAGSKAGYGNCIIVSHENGLATLYGHLSKVMVKSNQKVAVGEIIGKSGNSGRSTGPHLHYEVHQNHTPVNPKLFLNL